MTIDSRERTESFTVQIEDKDRVMFSRISGDFNPLHNSKDYAIKFGYERPVLHGAFLCGLVSRMAGMYLPGDDCLLHNIKINFIKPVFTPIKLLVSAKESIKGFVEVEILNNSNNELLAKADYKYSNREEQITLERKDMQKKLELTESKNRVSLNQSEYVLITGASGKLAQTLIDLSNYKLISVSRDCKNADINIRNYNELLSHQLPKLKAIIHCAWPTPLQIKLSEDSQTKTNLENQLSQPMLDVIALSKILRIKGSENSKLILLGSSYSFAGRHNWNTPYYSLAKGLLPTLSKILTFEFAELNKSVITVIPDWIPEGMNQNPSKFSIAVNKSRYPRRELASMHEIASFINWIIEAPSNLISGTSIELSNSASP